MSETRRPDALDFDQVMLRISMADCLPLDDDYGDFDIWRAEAVTGDGTGPAFLRIDAALVWQNLMTDAVDSLDGRSHSLSVVGKAVLEPTGQRIRPALAAKYDVEPDRPFLIVDHVEISDEWAHLGVGTLLTAIAIQRLAARFPFGLVACYPMPLLPTGSEASQRRAIRKLQRAWRSIGFEPYRNGVYVLNSNSLTFESAVEKKLAAVNQALAIPDSEEGH